MTDSMQRREFFRRSALVAAGVVAADQLDLLDRLGWTRKMFAAWGRPKLWGDSEHDDTEALNWYARNGVLVPSHRDYLISGIVDTHGRSLAKERISLTYDRRKGQAFRGWMTQAPREPVGVNVRYAASRPIREKGMESAGYIYTNLKWPKK